MDAVQGRNTSGVTTSGIATTTAALLTLGHKLIICGRSVSRWYEELHQLVKDCRICSLKVWIMTPIGVITVRICKELKLIIRRKKKSLESN